MATLRLYLDTRVKRQDGTFSIRLAVNHHGGTAFISLNQYCKKDEWDKRACKVRKLRIVMLSTTSCLTV